MLSWSMDDRLGSPSQRATGPPECGFSTCLRMASRTRSATLRPDRAATLRSAASSFAGKYTCIFSMYVGRGNESTYVKDRRRVRARRSYNIIDVYYTSYV